MKHTEASLKAMALRTGATVEVDGIVHNAGRAVVPLRSVPAAPAPVAKPEPPKAAEPAPMDPQLLALMAEVLRLQQLNASLVSSIKNALAEVKPESRPRKWSFTMVRNNKGLISRIDAQAQE